MSVYHDSSNTYFSWTGLFDRHIAADVGVSANFPAMSCAAEDIRRTPDHAFRAQLNQNCTVRPGHSTEDSPRVWKVSTGDLRIFLDPVSCVSIPPLRSSMPLLLRPLDDFVLHLLLDPLPPSEEFV
jgi:hypothetical protein